MKFNVFMAILLASLLGNVAVASIDEGIEYKLVKPAQPTITTKKVEVIELFWYGCPHCYKLEPHMKEWLAKKNRKTLFFIEFLPFLIWPGDYMLVPFILQSL